MAQETFQPDEGASKDCYLDQAGPDAPHATNAFIYVRNNTSWWWWTGLIAFDMSIIPPAAVIESASLYLWCYGVVQNNRSVSVHRILVEWDETATHNKRKTGVSWNVPGCGGSGTDHSATLMSSVSRDSTGEWEFVLNVSEFQAMFDDGAGYKGMRLRINATTSNEYRDFRSSNYAVSAQRPRLVVNYSLPSGSQIIWMMSKIQDFYNELKLGRIPPNKLLERYGELLPI